MNKIAIYGAGGYGREVACLIKHINMETLTWDLIGFFDDNLPIGYENEYGKVLGGMEELNSLLGPLSVVIAIGNPHILKKITDKIVNEKINFPNLIAPDVLFYDEDQLTLGIGNIIGFKSVISCNVKIGNFNIFNGNVLVGHDVCIEDYNVFNPSVRISGEVLIGKQNFFGVNSIVLQQKKIGQSVSLGVNSVIIKNPKDNKTYIGNPAIELKY